MKLEKSNEMLKEKVDSLKKSAQVNLFFPPSSTYIQYSLDPPYYTIDLQ